MGNASYTVNIDVSISIPIIGDASITKIVPPAGFSYKKIRFDEYQYKNRILDGDGNVVTDYYYAIHEEDDIYCNRGVWNTSKKGAG